MATGQNLFQAKQSLEGKIKSLINIDLKEICRRENLLVSGIKSTLQKRILEYVERAVIANDIVTFERIRYRVNTHGSSPPPEARHSNNIIPSRSTPLSPTSNGRMSTGYGQPSFSQYSSPRSFATTPRLSFRPSPFYNVKDAVTNPQDLPEMPGNRHTVNTSIILNQAVCESLQADRTLRLMLYCTTTTATHSFALHDVAFPNQLEVRLNGDEVKSNYKGLKNKSGTTKPADLTDYARKVAKYTNVLQITYALTTKKYTFLVNLVKKCSAEELTDKIRNGKIIRKDQVVQEMVNKARDPDIVATSVIMSLKDPVSTLRIGLPCRSIICTHNQCFDASYFLQLQEQAPTWTCPVCNKTISYDALAIDQYVQDILSRTPESTEQVTIEPAGEWSEIKPSEADKRGKSQSRAPYDNDSDDDIIEIPDGGGLSRVKAEAKSATPAAFAQQTPPLSSREASISNPFVARPNNSNGGGSKRGPNVIDLTLSDDDDEPPRPAKRQNTSQSTSYNTPASLPDVRNADVQNRLPPIFSHNTQPLRVDNRTDTLAPIQPSPQNAMANDGQRLPWHFGPSSVFRTLRDQSESYYNSP